MGKDFGAESCCSGECLLSEYWGPQSVIARLGQPLGKLLLLSPKCGGWWGPGTRQACSGSGCGGRSRPGWMPGL